MFVLLDLSNLCYFFFIPFNFLFVLVGLSNSYQILRWTLSDFSLFFGPSHIWVPPAPPKIMHLGEKENNGFHWNLNSVNRSQNARFFIICTFMRCPFAQMTRIKSNINSYNSIQYNATYLNPSLYLQMTNSTLYLLKNKQIYINRWYIAKNCLKYFW